MLLRKTINVSCILRVEKVNSTSDFHPRATLKATHRLNRETVNTKS